MVVVAASGKLEITKVGGPSAEMDTKMSRRGMYGEVSRVFPNDFQTLFDLPIPTLSAEKRYTTNVALQRLFFLNNEFVHKQAAAMAERVRGAGNDEAQVRKAFEIAYQRDPAAEELQMSLELLREPATAPVKHDVSMPSTALAAKPAPESGGVGTSTPAEETKPASAATKGPETPLEALCWALLSSNEFLFLN